MSDRDIAVIVPTRGLRERRDGLRAALDSILSQEGVCARPIVVLNGNMCCPEVARLLRGDSRLTLLELGPAGIPAALQLGRGAVQAPWFGTLDDDDVLLPGALAQRLAMLDGASDIDVVVTNGYRCEGAGRTLNIAPAVRIDGDPLRALLRRNWLLPGSWLARSDRVGPELFARMPRYLECTWLAVRFSMEYRMRWSDEPTVAYRVGSPLAESRSDDALTGQVEALRRILELDLPDDVRREFRRRVGGALHTLANHALRAGDRRMALAWHLRALRQPGGWRYLPFLRHLLPGARREAR